MDLLIRSPAPDSCTLCKSDIPKGALYCTSCGKYQKRRDRVLSSLGIGTILSLLPIATLCFAFINDRLIVPYSRIWITPLECSLNRVQFALSNDGSRSGVLTAGQITQYIDGRQQGDTFLLRADQSTIVEAGKSLILEMAIRSNDPDRRAASMQPPPQGHVCEYRIGVDLVDFGDDKAKSKGLSCKCPGS
jgi:hypothetical protein